MVVVNLCPDTEDATEFVRFDQAWVLRVLGRIAADLDGVARQDPAPALERPAESPAFPTRHRKRLAESEEKPRSRTAKEQREALRTAFGLPPYSGDYTEYFRQTRGTNTRVKCPVYWTRERTFLLRCSWKADLIFGRAEVGLEVRDRKAVVLLSQVILKRWATFMRRLVSRSEG